MVNAVINARGENRKGYDLLNRLLKTAIQLNSKNDEKVEEQHIHWTTYMNMKS